MNGETEWRRKGGKGADNYPNKEKTHMFIYVDGNP
jgi:hypothetical protein